MAVLSRTFPIANRVHRCTSCGGFIGQGQRYHRWTGTSPDGFWEGIATVKECARCCERYGRAGLAAIRESQVGREEMT